MKRASVRIVARCGSLPSNPTIFRYDFDILIANFGRDLIRIQSRIIFEFGLYAAGRRDFSASIRDRLVFVTGFYMRLYSTCKDHAARTNS